MALPSETRQDSGSTRWEANTRTVHHIVISMTDDMLASVESGDEVRVILSGRRWNVQKALSPRDIDRLTTT